MIFAACYCFYPSLVLGGVGRGRVGKEFKVILLILSEF